MSCAIWYHLSNLKNVKNIHGECYLKSECGKTRTRKTPNTGTFHAVKCLSVPKYAAVRCHKTLLVFTMELFLGKFWIKWSKNKFSNMQLILVQEVLGKCLDISKPINKHIAWMKVELKVWHLWLEFLCSCHRAFL